MTVCVVIPRNSSSDSSIVFSNLVKEGYWAITHRLSAYMKLRVP